MRPLPGPGFDPGLPWSDWVLDAREIWISICVPLEVWNPQPIKHNVQVPFVNQFYKNNIVLLTSKPHPRTASIHTVNFGSYRPSPWLNLINPGMRYYNRQACYRRNVALFCPFCEQEGETTYFGRLNNYFVKQTKHSWSRSWSRSLPTTTAPGLKEWQLLKAEVEDFDFFFCQLVVSI